MTTVQRQNKSLTAVIAKPSGHIVFMKIILDMLRHNVLGAVTCKLCLWKLKHRVYKHLIGVDKLVLNSILN
jgi:hypothetical protein